MRFIFTVIVTLYVGIVWGQTEIPKREFRAAWIATVGNIDWPSKKGLDAYTQQQEFIRIVDQLKYNGLNAVIVQIRPAADALYDSPYENWSRYLSGKQGLAPMPYYDPLSFMIQACHERCIEFHAWFNPYRALVEANKNPNTANHITYTHPEWFINYGGKKYFDPGLPEVRQYFTQIVLDVVKRYDIDAVHFDDYFYPYRIAGVEFADYASFAQYGKTFHSKDDWRRNNVNMLIESLGKKIKQTKSYVKFGISPFGVWRNASKDPEGSATRAGQTNYDDLYADVLLWLRKGWIDYVLPQLYWENGHRAADYATLINWWSQHSYNKHVYIGHGIYQLGSNKSCWQNLREIAHQIEQTRTTENISGSAFYSARSFLLNKLQINQAMHSQWYSSPALLPQMSWIDDEEPQAPVLRITTSANEQGGILSWQTNRNNKEDLQFAVYRFPLQHKTYIHDSKHLIAIVRNQTFTDKMYQENTYKYVVTALDRMHNESDMSNEVR